MPLSGQRGRSLTASEPRVADAEAAIRSGFGRWGSLLAAVLKELPAAPSLDAGQSRRRTPGFLAARPCSDLVAEAVARLHVVDGHLRSFIDVAPRSYRAGPVLARGDRSGGGLLEGLPIAVKGRTGYAAPATRRLVDVGAVPIGATSTPRGSGYQTWGFTERGPTRNPWRPDRSPGGSSAGAAAAVAAGIVELASGSDGAGSIRIPAAWCSVLGYKPTTGLASCSDPTGLATPGVLARDPRWLSAWADAVLDPVSPEADARAATVVWSDDLGIRGADVDDEVLATARRAAVQLSGAAGLWWRPATVALTDPHRAWTALRDPTAGPRRRWAADRDRRELADQLADVFSGTDLLMCPTTPRPPHGHDGPGAHLSVALTWGFNLTGHPAVSVPAGFTGDGCPVGLQIIARPYADRSLLALLERHVPTAAIAPVPTGRSQR